MAAIAQLRFSPLSNPYNLPGNRHFTDQSSSRSPLIISSNSPSSSPLNLSLYLLQSRDSNHKFAIRAELVDTCGDGGNGIGNRNSRGDGNNEGSWNSGSSGDGSDGDSSKNRYSSSFGILGLFLNVWRSRVAADP
ncbi:hypothetical protein BVC80_8915g9 [Macleaya cordata]|uniref:Uncharacterized protein n=1 Tax=Macleaya cordata TaxID=56857 RepID=A0A200QFV8_MACCD|nr:hypothetical protein BVC80_8915g9 [Macleaya cordata]